MKEIHFERNDHFEKNVNTHARTVIQNASMVEVAEQVIIPVVLEESEYTFDFSHEEVVNIGSSGMGVEKHANQVETQTASNTDEDGLKDGEMRRFSAEQVQGQLKFQHLEKNFTKIMDENKVLRDRVSVLENNNYRGRVVELERILGENDTHIRELQHDTSRYKEANESLMAKIKVLQENQKSELSVRGKELVVIQNEMSSKLSKL